MPAGGREAQTPRQHRGRTAYQSGLAAEASAERHYTGLGWTLADSRWRGANAEIDLIFTRDGSFLFVEVKSGRTHDLAAGHVGWDQLHRVIRAGELYAAQKAPGILAEMRFDVALIDSQGMVQVIENVSMTA